MNRTNAAAFATLKKKQEWESLQNGRDEDRRLRKAIDAVLDDLKKDPACGIKIQKRLWPREYLKAFGITNLWKMNLPDGWRLIYTIISDETTTVCMIIEWLPHKEYERRFGY